MHCGLLWMGMHSNTCNNSRNRNKHNSNLYTMHISEEKKTRKIKLVYNKRVVIQNSSLNPRHLNWNNNNWNHIRLSKLRRAKKHLISNTDTIYWKIDHEVIQSYTTFCSRYCCCMSYITSKRYCRRCCRQALCASKW